MVEIVDLTVERRYRATVRALVDSYVRLVFAECDASGEPECDYRRGPVRAQIKQFIFEKVREIAAP